MMDRYLDFLQTELKGREETQEVMRKFIAGPPALDPNWRLDQGYVHCLAKVIKDLAQILGKTLNDDFYPDLLGFMGDSEFDHLEDQ